MIFIVFLLSFVNPYRAFGENRFAFSRLTGDYWQIWIASSSGENPVQITNSPEDKKKPVWLPGGKICYLDNHGKLWVIDLKNNRKIPKALFAEYQIDSCSPGPGKNDLLLSVYETSGRDVSQIFVGNIISGRLYKLTEGIDLNCTPVLLSGKQKVIFTTTGKMRESKLMITDLEGIDTRIVLQNSFHNLSPSVSPDGKMIVFSSNISGNYDIWLLNLDNDSKHRLTDFNGPDINPQWSYNGAEILFVSTRGGRMGIWKMNPKGENLQAVTGKDVGAKDPFWETIPVQGESTDKP